MSIYVIGACNIDIVAHSDRPLVYKDSNPAKITTSLGGVGHNVAKNISSLYRDTYFVTFFGDDHLSSLAMEGCKKEGLDLRYAKNKKGRQSLYIALLDQDGDMTLGVNDMQIQEAITIEDLKDVIGVITEDDYLMIDNNLAKDVIEYLLKEVKAHKFTDAISTAKAPKLRSVLHYIDTLKVNVYEAEALIDEREETEDHLAYLTNKLLEKGIKEVLLSYKEGVYLGYDGEIYRYRHHQVRDVIVNATGAGDALLGAYIASRAKAKSIDEAIKDALIVSLLTIDHKDTVAPIDEALINDKMDMRKKIEGEKICI